MFTSQIIMIAVAIVGAIAVGLGVWIISLRRVVPTNMVHIVQTTKSTTPYGRNKPAGNTYYAWPTTLPILGISVSEFPESIFQVDLNDYEAYDSAKLPFMVDVTAFFRVDDAGMAAQSVSSFHELNRQLVSVLQGAVRRILATNDLEDTMQERAKLGQQFTDEIGEQIREWGVKTVKTVEFMDIRDIRSGNVIENIMAKEKSRIDKESRVAVAENARLANIKEIDTDRDVEMQRQDAEQQVGQRTAEKTKQVGIANEIASQQVKEQTKITTERDMEIKRVQDTRKAEIDKDVATVKAAQEKEVFVTETEANKISQNLLAEARLFAAQQNALGIKVEGEAKAEAEKLMLLAPVDTQITLAKEIGENSGYQKYLIDLEQIAANKEVGVAMSKALESADLKVIANSGDVTGGITNLSQVLTPKGGLSIGGMLESLSNTDEGKKLVNRLTGSDE